MRRREFSTLLGGAATASTIWTSRPSAQQKAIPLMGLLSAGVPDPSARAVAEFRHGLSETGYVRGKNLEIETRYAEGRLDRLPALAADLVGRKVDVIVAVADPAAHAAKEATSTIPIVFIAGDDPVRQGLVASLARAGGNITGVNLLTRELHPKRLE